MTTARTTTTAGWWRLLLAAIAAALVALLGAGTASATTLPEVETRVGASTPVTAHVVGVHESVSAGQRWDKAPPTTQIASATGVAAKAEVPLIKAGSAGGESAGKVFPQAVKDAARAENPGTCVFCRMDTKGQVDHAIPRARGGNATLDNAQIACPWCNASKGARDFPVNPPPGFRGDWPPAWWGLP